MGKKTINTIVNETAIALWAKTNPIEELKAIGFKKATDVEFELEDTCFMVFPEESEIAFGRVIRTSKDYIIVDCYEQIRSGELALCAQIPKKICLALKYENMSGKLMNSESTVN